MNFLLKYWLWIQSSQLDVPLQFFGAVFIVLAGYYIISKISKPSDKASQTFTVLYAFSISETFIIVRKLMQFFIDYFNGTNLMQTDMIPDDHWFFRVLGFGMSRQDQRPVFDMGEDFLLGTLGALLAAVGLFIYLGIKNKKSHKKERLTFSQWVKAIPEKCSVKYNAEKGKLAKQTNLADMLLWWCVRALMLHAFITMENRAEATLLLVNFLGTIAITVLHIIAPSDSFLGRIHYRVQSLLTIIVFWGSYGGNYIVLYGFINRFDKKLHFLSGIICVLAAYYLATEFINKNSKGRRTLTGIFAAVFSLMIIPVHEMTEFVGDFLWGTVNQGYCWPPDSDSPFYKVFGYGAENIRLDCVFDTMNDALFAVSSIVAAMIPLVVYLIVSKKNKNSKDYKTDTKNHVITR